MNSWHKREMLKQIKEDLEKINDILEEDSQKALDILKNIENLEQRMENNN